MSDTLYLIARVADQTVAIPSEQVDSVVDLRDVTPVPRAPAGIVGLAALRSRIVTVVDPRVALRLDGAARGDRAVIVRHDGHLYGMRVDAVDDVAPHAAEPVDGVVPLAPEWRGAARGTIVRDGAPILIVDLAALVPAGDGAMPA